MHTTLYLLNCTMQWKTSPHPPFRLLLEPRFLAAVLVLVLVLVLVRVRPWPLLASEELPWFVHLGRNCMDLTQVARPANTEPGRWSYGPADDTVRGRAFLIAQFQDHALHASHARLAALSVVVSNIEPDEASILSPRGPPVPDEGGYWVIPD
jgi:hypothetical protein